MKKQIALLSVFFLLILASCGTSKKLESAQNENAQLQAKNAALTGNVSDLQKQVNDLTASNKSMTDSYNTYKASCEASKAKLQALQSDINDLYATLQLVEKKVEAAEANFKSKGVDVSYKDGLVYVRMQDALLYKSGSATLDPKGEAALGNLAAVLNDYPKLKVIVVGNTDSVQFKKGNNWSLSTDRANGVVRLLQNKYNVDPTRLTAAGRGKFDPIANNSTVDGRAANRRTEIILNPDIRKMWADAEAEINSK